MPLPTLSPVVGQLRGSVMASPSNVALFDSNADLRSMSPASNDRPRTADSASPMSRGTPSRASQVMFPPVSDVVLDSAITAAMPARPGSAGVLTPKRAGSRLPPSASAVGHTMTPVSRGKAAYGGIVHPKFTAGSPDSQVTNTSATIAGSPAKK